MYETVESQIAQYMFMAPFSLLDLVFTFLNVINRCPDKKYNQLKDISAQMGLGKIPKAILRLMESRDSSLPFNR